MKIVTYNIRYGLGRDNQFDLPRIARALANADIVCLQEVERFWERSGEVDQVDELSRLLPGFYCVYGANLDMHKVCANGAVVRRQFGNLIFSRWPVISTRNFPLPKRAAIHQHSIQQGLLEAVIDADGLPLRVYTTHLSHLCAETRLPQVDAIMEFVAAAPHEGGAWCGGHPNEADGWIEGEMPAMPETMILTGDLNFDHRSEEYSRVTGPVSVKHGRLISPTGLCDAWVAAGHEEAEGVTQPRKPHRIDHCFISAAQMPRVRSAWVDTLAQGSDHYPLWIELEPAGV